MAQYLHSIMEPSKDDYMEQQRLLMGLLSEVNSNTRDCTTAVQDLRARFSTMEQQQLSTQREVDLMKSSQVVTQSMMEAAAQSQTSQTW